MSQFQNNRFIICSCLSCSEQELGLIKLPAFISFFFFFFILAYVILFSTIPRESIMSYAYRDNAHFNSYFYFLQYIMVSYLFQV